MTIGLTPTQRDALLVIQELAALDGRPPSLKEIAAEIGLANTSGAKRLIDRLAERGHLTAGHYRHRSLTVLRPIPIPEEPGIEVTEAGRAYLEGVSA